MSVHYTSAVACLLLIVCGCSGQSTDDSPEISPTASQVSRGERVTVNCSLSSLGSVQWVKVSSPVLSPTTCAVSSGSGMGSGMGMLGSGMSGTGQSSGSGSGDSMIGGTSSEAVPTSATTTGSASTEALNNSTNATGSLLSLISAGTVIVNNSQLVLDQTMFGDEGFYVCVFRVESDTCYSASFNLTVAPGNLSIILSPSETVSRGETVTLNCSAEGGPDNSFQWQKNGADLSGENGTTLQLTSVDASHGGEYTCIVSNAAGNESSNSTLNIRPYITTQPQVLTLRNDGDNATLNCEAMGFPSPSYHWEKVNDSFRSESSLVGNLVFTGLMFGNEGSYECVATVDTGAANFTSRSQPGELILSPRGSVNAATSIENSAPGDVVVLSCSAEGGPGNQFSWTRLLDNTAVGSESNLTVNVTSANDGGGYRCTVSNLAGNESTTVTLNVAPVIDSPPESVNVTSTEETSLTCTVSGFPLPNITWLHNGSQFEEDENRTSVMTTGSTARSITSRLSISTAMVNDSGDYVCNASSSGYATISSDTARVLVQNTPERPVNVTAVGISTDTVQLQWVEPHDNNAPILGYRVSYTQPGFLGGGVVTVNSSEESVNITGLHPGSDYSFTVIAFNDIGVSAPSDLLMIETLETAPTAPPQNVSVVVLSSTMMNVSWDEIEEFHRRGNIVMYEVLYEPLIPLGAMIASQVSTNDTFVTLTGLEEFSEYNISVRGLTSAGAGPSSEGTVRRTLEDEPSSPPDGVVVSALSSTSLRVEWMEVPAIDQNGMIVLYEVRYDPLATFSGLTEQTVNTTNMSAILMELEEFVEYNISLRAYTSVGPGPYSEGVVNRTLEAAPSSPPSGVTAVPVSSSDITVSWGTVPPADQNGIITSYQILYTSLFDFSTDNVTVNGTTFSATLTNLEENVNYSISVRASTIVGPGPFSLALIVRTDEHVPTSPPQNVVTVVLSSSAIGVFWEEPPIRQQNGIITTYEVTYQPLETFNNAISSNSLNTTNISATITGLQAYVEYNISVRAYTSVGPGPYSEGIVNRTLEDVPSASPENLVLMALSSTSIVANWTQVPAIEQNGIITRYEVRYRSMFDNMDLSQFVNGSTTLTTTLDGLHEFANYTVSVRAYTSIGPGPYSNDSTVQTDQDEPSSPPANVSATVLSSTEIMVSWDDIPEIDQNGIVLRYEVLYQPLTTFGVLVPLSNTTESMSFNITGLQEYVEYNISVRGLTSVGAGPYSEVVIRRTFEDVPSGSPLNLTVVSSGPTSLNLSWLEPREIDINGILTLYTIEYSPTNEPNTVAELLNVSNTTLSTTLTGLLNFTNYTVSVSANTVIGRGPRISEIEPTDENIPGMAPRNVTVESESSTSISVQWEPPDSDFIFGIIRSYQVRYSITGSSGVGTVVTVTDVSNRSLTISGLMEFTNYSVEVAATTVGDGPYSDPVTVVTDQDIPGDVARPPEVNETTITSSSALLTWSAPADSNGEIIQYTVNVVIASANRRRRQLVSSNVDPACIRGGSQNSNRNFNVTGTPPNTYLFVNHLTPYVSYQFRVQAATIIGPGNFSQPRTFSTAQDVPSEPRNLSVTASSSTSLQLAWVAPQCDNGVRTGYNLTQVAILGEFLPLGAVGQVADISNDANIQSVSITGLTPFTNYTISLCAFTSVGCGQLSIDTQQTLEDSPSPVTNLMISSMRLSSSLNRVMVRFSWTAPSQRNGPFNIQLSYTANQTLPYPVIRQNNVAGGPITLSGSATSYNVPVENGLPFADFVVNVVAYNVRRGIANFSSQLKTATMKSLAIEPSEVLSLSARSTSHQSVSVHWDIPQYPNSEIIRYDVYYRISSTLQSPPSNNAGYSISRNDTRTRDLTGLDPFTNYTVYVRAIGNPDLQGRAMEEVIVRTDIFNSSSVLNPAASALNSSSISVSWSKPERLNGPLSHYVVYYQQSNTVQTPGAISSDGFSTQRADSTSAVITNLIPFTNYAFHIRAFVTERGNTLQGEVNQEVIQRTNSDVPNFSLTPNTDTTTAAPTHLEINILIPSPSQIITGRVVFVGVVVVRNPPSKSSFNQAEYSDNIPYNEINPPTYYITAAWDELAIQRQQVPGIFTVGDNMGTMMVNGVTYTNVFLSSNTDYAVFVRYEIMSDTSSTNLVAFSSTYFTRTALPFSVAGLVIGFLLVIAVIIIVVVLAVVLFRRFRRRKVFVPGTTTDPGFPLPPTKAEANEAPSFNTMFTNTTALEQHTGTHEPVPVREFAEHVKNLHCNDDYLFTEEYSSVEPNHAPTSEATRRPANISKNRYANITAYDHSRVKLQFIPDEEGSDYINGNYIDGYRSTNAFIATQGPVPASVADFWRMVWEQASATIVMLTNLEEKGRVKCHKYWPDERAVVHGDIRIQYQETLSLADYVIRTFSLSRCGSKEERIVRQFHYTVWPDHGVPEYPTPLLHFVRKVMSSNPKNSGPIVVHCSAGVGRTGTFITVFTQLKQIQVDNDVDIFGFVQGMRRRRCYMVQTEPQYIFLHDAILEAIECGVTEVPARDLQKQYRRLQTRKPGAEENGLEIEFQKLKTTIHAQSSIAVGTMPASKRKNRYADTLPYDKSRCRLSIIPGETGSDYINASHINGYHKRKAFLATQGPLPDTTDDFWRMIWEQNCATIVMLTKEREKGKIKCHHYWPDSGAGSYANLQVILHTANEYPDYTLREFKVVDTRDGSSLPVKQFQYTGWPEEGVPDSGSGFIDLIGQVQKWQRSSGDKPIIVHCSGGTGRTGTCIAVSILLERLKTEGMVDVFQTVRALRLQRPGLVRTVLQYEFCYKTILEFLESFELYSNFK